MVSNETARRWFLKFRNLIASNLRRSRPQPSGIQLTTKVLFPIEFPNQVGMLRLRRHCFAPNVVAALLKTT